MFIYLFIYLYYSFILYLYNLQGFEPVIREKAPNVISRKCAKHIYDNFKLKWGSVLLRKHYWRAATAYTE